MAIRLVLFLVLFISPTHSIWINPLCPVNCRCQISATRLMVVGCHDAGERRFEDELNALFEESRNFNITEVVIQRTPLSTLSSLNMSYLSRTVSNLNLNFNRITRLPSGYFAHFPQLRQLLAVGNNITMLGEDDFTGLDNLNVLDLSNNSIVALDEGAFSELKHVDAIRLSANDIRSLADDLFVGLTLLRTIDLRNNSIVDIGPRTFLNLPSIEEILISFNPLRTLDVWPVRVAVEVPHKTRIMIEGTDVSAFTNQLNWLYTCFMPPANSEISLESSKVRHITDALIGLMSNWSDISILCLWKTDSFRINLIGNPLVCDCVDFVLYKFFKLTKKAAVIDQLLCYDPDNWRGTKIILHSLGDFVCRLSGGCPWGCRCLQRPYNMTVDIGCQGIEITQLPDAVPTFANLTLYRYELHFGGNAFAVLESRPYFNRTHLADFSHNDIERVELEAIGALTRGPCRILYLHGNRLKTLPKAIARLDLGQLAELSLYDNPWSCKCPDKWLSSWLRIVRSRLLSPDAILCREPIWLFGRSVISLNESDFCSNPRLSKVVLISEIVGGTLAVVLLLGVLPIGFVYFRRVWVYSFFQWHPFDWDECEGEEKEYDAFFSYSDDNQDWVLPLIRDLERRGFRILFHRRDFHGGTPITVNVENAIDRSKRTVCVVSAAFVESNICMWEFDTALSLIVRGNGSRLVVIKYEEVEPTSLPRSVYYYMTRYAYVDRHSPHFMENLLYSLPIRRLRSINADTIQQEEESVRDTDQLLEL
ncbi:hypothetical protein LSH36_84g05051 [Paralvinella palmiformis]|uniref:TIR domain-containing protein n=1 Tax=Paralvinella palmiformis TaxID=53620 RepID=A0AAD9K1S1_9ANNE|nr:hypothetical protein LSH36_84g05051 [Paralvinella palmiformis]